MTVNTENMIQAPWETAGVSLDMSAPRTSLEVMEQAKRNWKVSGQPLHTSPFESESVVSFIDVPSHKAIIREGDNAILGVVGGNWNILQNYEVFQFVDELQSMGLLKYHSAGSFKDGKIIWIQAEFAEIEILPNDVHKKYLLFVNAFDGSFSVRIGQTDIRVICYNTMVMAARDAAKNGVSIRHTASMREKLAKAKEALILSQEISKTFDMFQKALAQLHMSADMWDRFGKAVVPEPGEGKNKTRSENARNQLVSLSLTGVGQDIPGVAGTAYAALNGLTEYVNYHRTARGKDDDKKQAGRFHSTLFGSGRRLIETGVETLNGFLVEKGIQVETVL